jgi:predicted nucleic acid-binding protein
VVRWLNNHFAESAISTVSVFELFAGVAALPKGKRRDVLHSAIERAIRRLADRVYAFDEASARAAARLLGEARSAGRGARVIPDHVTDLQIAGTAVAHGLSLATRNERDFEPFGLHLINPWTQ